MARQHKNALTSLLLNESVHRQPNWLTYSCLWHPIPWALTEIKCCWNKQLSSKTYKWIKNIPAAWLFVLFVFFICPNTYKTVKTHYSVVPVTAIPPLHHCSVDNRHQDDAHQYVRARIVLLWVWCLISVKDTGWIHLKVPGTVCAVEPEPQLKERVQTQT